MASIVLKFIYVCAHIRTMPTHTHTHTHTYTHTHTHIHTDMLLLGRTNKVIRVTNPNTGVASVASVTLQKLVVPLKVLNINDRELTLLKEIVLFNAGNHVIVT